MSEIRELMINSAGRLFSELAEQQVWQQVEAGQWPSAAWQKLADMGLPLALVSEAQGGSELDVADGLALADLSGYYALPLPLVETLIANYLMTAGDMAAAEGPVTIHTPREQALELQRSTKGWAVSGELTRVPWGRHVNSVLVSAELEQQSYLLCIPSKDLAWRHGINLAGEPRDTASVEGVALTDANVAVFPDETPDLMEWGGLVRSLQMAGAMRRALELSVQYANERVQFGRPIAKFQAVQQLLAGMAGQVAAAGAAADAGAAGLGTPHHAFSVAVAKARVSEAAGQAAAAAHQVHAAMGYTREHSLHLSTRRLWSWRDEFGTEAYWQRRIGLAAAGGGKDGLWPYLTSL